MRLCYLWLSADRLTGEPEMINNTPDVDVVKEWNGGMEGGIDHQQLSRIFGVSDDDTC